MIKLNKINQYYAQSHTLWDLSLDIKEGSCTCIMGRNGVGKTTLTKAIMGLLPLKNGQIIYEGQDISQLSSDKRAGLGIGYVPQGRDIFSQLSVKENLERLMVTSKKLKNVQQDCFYKERRFFIRI